MRNTPAQSASSASAPGPRDGGPSAPGAGAARPALKAAPAAVRPPTPGGLASAKAPPFRLPGEHFAGALALLACGSLGLVLVAPELAQGAFLDTRMIGATHLFTLGWITTSIMGALYQFLPVATGEPIRSVRLAHISFALYLPGLLAFVAGLLFGRTPLLLVGATAMGTGILLFVGNLAVTLHGASRHDITWWALVCAAVFLVVTLTFGLILAGNLRWGYLGGTRMLVLGTHLHVALAGWVLMVMIGVAHRLLPMFLLSHGATDRFGWWALRLVAAGAAALTVLHHAPAPIGRWLPALLITGGCAAFLLQARAFYRRRVRRAIDPGMRLAAVALGILGVGLLLAWPVALRLVGIRFAATYIATLITGITLFVAALYYKIIPFLVWYHRWGSLAGKQAVPRVSELYSARIAKVASAILVVGGVGVPLGIALASTIWIRVAALVFGLGVLVLSGQMFAMSRSAP